MSWHSSCTPLEGTGAAASNHRTKTHHGAIGPFTTCLGDGRRSQHYNLNLSLHNYSQQGCLTIDTRIWGKNLHAVNWNNADYFSYLKLILRRSLEATPQGNIPLWSHDWLNAGDVIDQNYASTIHVDPNDVLLGSFACCLLWEL